MEHKSYTKVHVFNLIFSILLSIAIGYGIDELTKNFILSNMNIIICSIVYVVILLIISIAGLREMHPPEILDPFENHYMQITMLLFLGILIIGTSTAGIVIGILTIIYSICATVFVKYENKTNVNNESSVFGNSV